ncbi:MAG: hypothetical protein IAG10_05370 [Planctomycetaceae bacterium]|nr:hypothetical protein [Planctomycetaceae bacterium]
MRTVARVLNWIGRACNRLHWARYYFISPPDESDPEEMRLYNQRLKW